jgi:hypothetical protein
MAKTTKTTAKTAATAVNTERTSSNVASIAGRLLNGRSLKEAEVWLQGIIESSGVDNDRTHALTLLGALAGMRSIAASALTQR